MGKFGSFLGSSIGNSIANKAVSKGMKKYSLPNKISGIKATPSMMSNARKASPELASIVDNISSETSKVQNLTGEINLNDIT